jgi:fibronectin-binding autotransporter adhesin
VVWAASFAGANVTNWTGPGSDFNTASNWDNGVPGDAVFGASGPTDIQVSKPGAIGSMTFDSGASPYTITLNATTIGLVYLTGAGIVNNSGVTQTIINQNANGSGFVNSATAGDARILNRSALQFNAYSSAGNATLINNDLRDNRGEEIWFRDYSSAGNATIINHGGDVRFMESSNGGNATIVNDGGTVQTVESSECGGFISGCVGASTVPFTAGSIAGSGNFYMGVRSWMVGSNNTDTVVTGTLTDANSPFDPRRAALLKIGTGTLTLLGANTYGGGTQVLGGTLIGNSTSLQGDILNEASLVFDQSGNGQYAGVISGTGTFTKTGQGLLTLSGANSYTGATQIDQGAINLTGSLSGDTTVNSNGALAGSGRLQNLTNNGLVVPGAGGFGSLHAASYSGAGTLGILLVGRSNTSLRVDGNADLTGGSLYVAGIPGGTGQYDIVSAGSISGTFSKVTTPNLPFLTFDTRYTGTDVYFDVGRSTSPFVSVARTDNQHGVAAVLDRALNQSDVFSKVISAVASLTPDQAQSAYSQLSGDALASFHAADLKNAAHFAQQMNRRSNSPEGSVHAQASAPVQLAYAGDIRDLHLGTDAGKSSMGIWSRGVGIFDHTDGDSALGSPSSQANTAGFQSGYDFAVGENGLVGFSGGYGKTSLSVSDRSSAGDSTALQFGVYGGYQAGQWDYNGSLSYASISNTNSRHIVFPGVDETASARFHSDVFTAFGETGYVFHPRPALRLEPTVSIRESHLHQNGYTESGAPGLDLMTGDEDSDSVVSSLGLRLNRSFRANTAHPIDLGVRAAWDYQLTDIDNVISAQFADAPGAGFTVQSTPQSRHAASLGFDGRIDLYRNLQLFADYAATLSAGEDIQSVLGGLSFRW